MLSWVHTISWTAEVLVRRRGGRRRQQRAAKEGSALTRRAGNDSLGVQRVNGDD